VAEGVDREWEACRMVGLGSANCCNSSLTIRRDNLCGRSDVSGETPEISTSVFERRFRRAEIRLPRGDLKRLN